MTIDSVCSQESNHNEHIDSHENSGSKTELTKGYNEGPLDQYNSIEGVIFLILREGLISNYEKPSFVYATNYFYVCFKIL